MAVYLRLLTDPHLRVDGKTVELPEGKSIALLVYLALRGSWVSRAELAAFFRPDADETTARHYLRLMLSRIRHLPWLKDLEVTPQRLRWTVDSDVTRFQTSLREGNISEAIKVYERPLLQGVSDTNLPDYDSWLELERQSLQTTYRNVVLEYTKSAVQPKQAAQLLKKLLDDDILSEDIVQRYMTLCYQLGDVSEATRIFEIFAQTLSVELGLQPLPETMKLAEAIRASQPLQNVHVSAISMQQKVSAPLVGRDDILGQLKTTAHTTVLIAGEPGIGKTRLLQEALPDALYLRSPEGLSNVPYYALVSHAREHPEQLTKYQREFSRLIPELSEKNVVDEALDKVRLLGAWKEYLSSFSKPIIFDDVQWADDATLELLIYLAQQKTLQSFVAYRSNEVSEALQKTLQGLKKDALELFLGPLDDGAVAALVEHFSNDVAVTENLFAYTGGNPFFMIETLKNLDPKNKTFDVPKAVTELVAQRVQKLSEVAQRVTQAAAVLGDRLTPELLAKLTGLSSWSVVEGLEEAEGAGILKENNFSHDLMRQSIYTSLSGARRSLLHREIAKGLKGAEPTVVAKHWELSGDKEKAVEFYRKAAGKLEQLGLYEEASKLTEHLLTLAPKFKDQHLASLAIMYHVLGRAEALGLCEPLLHSSDTLARAQALTTLARMKLEQGQVGEAAQLLSEAESLSEEAEHFDSEVFTAEQLRDEILAMQMSLLHSTGRFEEALALVEKALQSPKRLSQVNLLGLAISRASIYDNLGRSDEATTLHRSNVRLAKKLGARYHHIHAASNLLANLIDLKRPEEGLAEATEALKLDHPSDTLLRNNLASVYRRLERYDEAIALYRRLVHDDNKAVRALAWSSLANIYQALNNEEQVYEALEHALLSLRDTDHPISKGRVCIVVIKYGNDAQKTNLRPYLDSLELATLPPDVRGELEPLLGALANHLP
jgi:DNA-binding SARP family transcriptional activator/tetratricopeptide (TPR) repeat protein